MHTMMPEFLTSKPQPVLKPAPPTKQMVDALRRPAPVAACPPLDDNGVPMEEAPRRRDKPVAVFPPRTSEANPLFKFEFRRPWFGEYTTKDYKFVLRVEHFPELMRLVNEFNKNKAADEFPVGVSDIVSAALDFVLEHPLVLTDVERPEHIREAMARAVYRKAMFRFIQLYELC